MKKRILANPDEPRAGQFAYELYNQAHPVHGSAGEINYWRQQLRGMTGRTVEVTVRGAIIDPDSGEKRRFTASHTIELNSYSDLFGAGGAYGEILHPIRDENSDDELVVFSVEVSDE